MWKIGIFLSFLLLISGCQNSNIFGWLHKEGADKSPEALLADAESMLENDKPTDAKIYAEEILKKDPDNSEALYIHAQATLQEAGFDIGGIISDAIKSADDSQSTDSLLETFESMDINQVAQAINTAVEDLRKIVEEGDGSISPDDVDVNLNLGILEVLDAALELVDFNDNYVIINDTSDIIQIDENYNVTVKGKQIDEFNPDTDLTSDEKNKLLQDVENAINQIVDAAEHITTAAQSAGLLDDTETSTIEELKQDIETDLKAQLEELKQHLQ